MVAVLAIVRRIRSLGSKINRHEWDARDGWTPVGIAFWFVACIVLVLILADAASRTGTRAPSGVLLLLLLLLLALFFTDRPIAPTTFARYASTPDAPATHRDARAPELRNRSDKKRQPGTKT